MTSVARAPRPAPRRRVEVEPRRPALYVVDQPGRARRRGSRSVAVLSVAVVIVFGSLLASAVFHSLLVTGQDRLDTLNSQIRAEQEGLNRDRLALARAQSPERIAREAHRLGMVPAEDPTWIDPSAPTESDEDSKQADPNNSNEADTSGRGGAPDADTADASEVA